MKTVDRQSNAGYTSIEEVVPMNIGTVDLSKNVETVELQVRHKSSKLFFDNVVAGEPTQVAKNAELVVAATFGDLVRVKDLVAQHADVHTGNDRPLQIAAANGHTDTVEFLLQHGAEADAEDNEALISAAKSGYCDVVSLLLNHGADAHARNDEALRLAKEFQVQSRGAFRARRPTPENGHAKTIDLIRTLSSPPNR